MNWDWAASLDHIWRSPTFPMWLTLAAAGFFGLDRADHAVARGEIRRQWRADGHHAARDRGCGRRDHASASVRRGGGASADSRPAVPVSAALPQLSCIDDLAGDTVLNACEKTLFGSANSAAAAVAYAASQITRLTGSAISPPPRRRRRSDLQALRRAVERDRYGLMAYVLMARDHCTRGGLPGVRFAGRQAAGHRQHGRTRSTRA